MFERQSELINAKDLTAGAFYWSKYFSIEQARKSTKCKKRKCNISSYCKHAVIFAKSQVKPINTYIYFLLRRVYCIVVTRQLGTYYTLRYWTLTRNWRRKRCFDCIFTHTVREIQRFVNKHFWKDIHVLLMFKGGLTLVHHVVQSILIRYCHKSSSATIKFIRKDGREKLRSLSHSLQFAKSSFKKINEVYF